MNIEMKHLRDEENPWACAKGINLHEKRPVVSDGVI